MNKYLVMGLFILALVSMLIISGCSSSGDEINGYTGEELDKKVDNMVGDKFTIIDVRTPDEYNAGHIKYSFNLPLQALADNLNIIDDLKDKPIVVICRSGNRSGQAQQMLLSKGFTDVRNAEGFGVYQYKNSTFVPFLRAKQFTDYIQTGEYPIIDARDKSAYDAAHIENAVNVPLSTAIDESGNYVAELPELAAVSNEKPVFVYADNAENAYKMCEYLFDKDYVCVCSLDGIDEYDYPVINEINQ